MDAVVAEVSISTYAEHLDHGLAREAMGAIGRLSLPVEDVNEIGNTAGSPIESMMVCALAVIARQDFSDIWLNPRKSNWQPRMDKIYDLLEISQQEEIGQYRVDIFVTLHARIFSDGSARLVSHSVVVECDGHEFHERTKDQASRDKKRDRFLQGRGLHVLRFTGSDIWNDVFSHAQEVIDFLKSRMGAGY
jgi:very-short-patch-repair endonuclease